VEKKLRKTLLGGKFQNVPEVRSRVMKAIRSRGNRTTEKRLRALMVRHGIRGWVIHPRDVPGTPEFYFSARKLALFTDGCFWHGCADCCGRKTTTNRAFWQRRIELNRQRDHRTDDRLAKAGIRVLRFWEHELKLEPSACIEKIRAVLILRRRG
jgi:DNA mismatch endonuclease (patch repair protein)